jgi:hypothetical protein
VPLEVVELELGGDRLKLRLQPVEPLLALEGVEPCRDLDSEMRLVGG